ncbi:MAG: hypothetical protein H6550_03375 [Chitinophagales bacterium]|nr:hypothetical protein [Chitinophagales bacterium]
MKKLLAVLMLLPGVSLAQKNEITFSTGLNFQPTSDFRDMDNGDTRVALSYLRTIDKLQVGVRLVAGSDFFMYEYITPELLVNKKFNILRSYLYAGTAAGYYQRNEGMYAPKQHMRGYTLGLQGGAAFYLSKHFSLTTEVAVRSTQFWYKVYGFYPMLTNQQGITEYYRADKIENDFFVSFPVTFGLRYRF